MGCESCEDKHKDLGIIVAELAIVVSGDAKKCKITGNNHTVNENIGLCKDSADSLIEILKDKFVIEYLGRMLPDSFSGRTDYATFVKKTDNAHYADLDKKIVYRRLVYDLYSEPKSEE